jgi:hypothetical protein
VDSQQLVSKYLKCRLSDREQLPAKANTPPHTGEPKALPFILTFQSLTDAGRLAQHMPLVMAGPEVKEELKKKPKKKLNV